MRLPAAAVLLLGLHLASGLQDRAGSRKSENIRARSGLNR
jgi:hypothetical protein